MVSDWQDPEGLTVVSLFDGISCGLLALLRAGFKIKRYVAYEIDPDAILVSEWNWPGIEHRGSVEGADFTEFAGADLVIGGFPCTDLSIGKTDREGLKGKSSKLFWEQVRAISEIKPRYFLVENNYGMPKKDEAIITETLGVDPVYINSALVSAQMRKRLYWTNIPNVTAPEDKGIYLKDILGINPHLKYYQTTGAYAIAFRARKYRTGDSFKVPEVQLSGKSNALTTVQSDSMVISEARGIQPQPLDRNYKAKGMPREETLEVFGEEKSYTIMAQKIPSVIHLTPDKSYCLTANYSKVGISDIAKGKRTQVFEAPRESAGVYIVSAGLLSYREREIPVKLADGYYAIRKLTPEECERLQTLPDGYTEMVSNTQRYRQLGNGWTVDVIAHIFNHIHLDLLL